jgi:hypothetical protein
MFDDDDGNNNNNNENQKCIADDIGRCYMHIYTRG